MRRVPLPDVAEIVCIPMSAAADVYNILYIYIRYNPSNGMQTRP